MSKVVLITNIPSPYRVDLFYYIQTHVKEYELHVIYTSEKEENRFWEIPKEKLRNSYILKSKIFRINGLIDKRYVHFPLNIGKKLNEIDPDVVIAMEYNPAALQALYWSKKNKKKFIHLTDGTLFSEYNIGRIQKIARRIITSRCDAAIASSTKAKEKLLAWGVPKEKIFISLLTVDIKPYCEIAHQRFSGGW